MEIRLLGGVAAHVDGVPVALGGVRQRALLARLALDAGRPVHADHLVADVWADDGGGAVRPLNALQAAISRLRKVLGRSVVVAAGGGYRLEVPDAAVDALAFERDLAAARDAARADSGDAIPRYVRALARWRGPALDDLGDFEFARAAAARLAELRAVAAEELADLRLGRGDAAALVPDLDAAVRAEPLRERRYAQLMVALARAGRQADALRTYQGAREVLAEQLGIEPGPELRALEQRILDQDSTVVGEAGPATVAAAAPARPGAPAAPASAPGRRPPAARSSFVGRERDLDAIAGHLGTARLVTIVGPGGAGKTRCAAEVARRTPGAVWFCELAAVTDPGDVPDAVASPCGATAAAPHAGGTTGDATGDATEEANQRVVLHVGDRPALLVLDNCEHVVGAAAEVVDTLLERCAGLRVLATSREALAVPGEQLWPLAALDRPDAVDLFVARARAVQPTFGIDAAGERAVADICARLDGLPLAIELAAARVRAIPVAQLASRLDDRFRLLTAGSRTAAPRQQTLRAVVDWSYDLLFEAEQCVFARLSVFAGGAALDAAAVVLGGGVVPEDEVVDLVLRLVDKSLAVTEDDGRGGVRIRMLETLRDYARERLLERGEEDEYRARHARWCAALVVQADDELRGPGQRTWLPVIDREHENLRAALEWAATHDGAVLAVLASRLAWYWYLRGRMGEAQRWLAAAHAVDGLPPRERAFVDLWSGFVHHREGDEGARERVASAVDYFAAEGDVANHALAVVARTATNIRTASRALAIDELAQARAVGDTAGNKWCAAVTSLLESDVAHALGDPELAQRAARTALDAFRDVGDDWGVTQMTMALGHILEARGEYDEASAAYEQSLDVARGSGFAEYESSMVAHLGNIATLRGDHEAARRLHERAIGLAEGLGVTAYAFALTSAGFGARRAGDLDRARRMFREAAELYRSSFWYAGQAQAMGGWGLVEELAGDLDTAVRLHREAYEIVRPLEMPRATAFALEGLAAALAASDPERAARLLGAAATIRDRSGGPLPAGERVDVDRAEAAIAAVLGADGLDRGCRAGRSLVDHLDALVTGVVER